jgi:hypothetical protein
MMTVAGNTDRNYYVLAFDHPNGGTFYWLSTLATNRHDSWKVAYRYVRDHAAAPKPQLKREGYRCVRVRIEMQEGR